MSNLRFKALEITLSRKPKHFEFPAERLPEMFGKLTFGKKQMQEYFSRETFQKLMDTIERGERIDRNLADHVAAALKSWALRNGATHYAHWFQPLTGDTAEKHDGFISIESNGDVIEKFTGNQLVQQEPDASSFPSGGLRNTFEARGYTAWDPSSPAFILDRTLCIPSVFVAYTGEALDYKTPLIKALSFIDKAATRTCNLFDKEVSSVKATLGIEQEYFLVDEALYKARPDLMLTGRTVFGHSSAKDQQLEDNYFGAIPERVIAFMKEFEIEAYKLGIPVKTRHNEVAPNQFECAPIFEEVNLAIDHNQLLMGLLEKVARKHDFIVLLHEKPFAGVNGSGKHNNWSLQTNTGINLLKPGTTPKSNLRFLTFLVCIIKAVDEHAALLRASIASAGNALRLGANEAPPAIMSVFIGSQLTKTLEEVVHGKNRLARSIRNQENGIVIPKIPDILPDNTDRNRTSPFAFTGDKFEFRAVGSSANCAAAMITLNTIVAHQLNLFCDEVEKLIRKGKKKDDALLTVIRKYITESERVRFEGNNYSEEWVKEAERRGLPNIKLTSDALKHLVTEKSIEVFEKNKILTRRELHARYEIEAERYVKKIQIESRVIGDLAINHIIPTVLKYQSILIQNVRGMKELYDSKTYTRIASSQLQNIADISEHVNAIRSMVCEMIEERKKANVIDDIEKKADAYAHNVLPFFDKIREHTDKLELLVDDQLWALPKYRELLFTR